MWFGLFAVGAIPSLGPVQDLNLMRGSAAGLIGRGELLGLASWPLGAFSITRLVLATGKVSLPANLMRRAARSFWVMVFWCVTSGVLWPRGLLLRF